MIVYFSKKSKDSIIRWVVGGLSLILLFYIMFVWIKIIRNDIKSIQIIRVEESIYTSKDNLPSDSDQSYQTGEKSFVASKIGKYYYPVNCSKAKTLSVKNMLYFKDKMTAEKAGFREYLGCK